DNRVVSRKIHARALQDPLTPRPQLPAQITFEHFLKRILQGVCKIRPWFSPALTAGMEILQKIGPLSYKGRERPLLASMATRIFECALKKQPSDSINIGCRNVAPEPHCLKRYCSPACKRVEHARHVAPVCLPNLIPQVLQVLAISSIPG